MKRPARLPSFPVRVDRDDRTPLWRQLAIGIRFAIAAGRLPRGARLPSTRALARQLAVSRNTVSMAYDELAASGLLSGAVGRGSFVTTAVTYPRVRRCLRDVSGNTLGLITL